MKILSSEQLGDFVIQNWKVTLWPNIQEVSLFREVSDVFFGIALISFFASCLSSHKIN